MLKREGAATNSHNNVVLLTGASQGIGRALARQLDQQGCRLLLVGRNRAASECAAREFTGDPVALVAGWILDPAAWVEKRMFPLKSEEMAAALSILSGPREVSYIGLVDNQQMLHSGMPGYGRRVLRVIMCNPIAIEYPIDIGVMETPENQEGAKTVLDHIMSTRSKY